MVFQAQQPGTLSSALQAASPLLLGAAQGLRQGNFQGGLQQGLAGMMQLQERNKEKAAEAKVNDVLKGMNIPTAQRAILETMPLAQKQQFLMRQMQRPAGGGGGPAPSAPPAADPYAGILGGLMSGGGQPFSGPAMPASMGSGMPLSFGTPEAMQGGAGQGNVQGGAGSDRIPVGLAFNLGSSVPASEAMLPGAPIRPQGAPAQAMTMPRPPPPAPVDPKEQIVTRIGQIDQALQRAVVDPNVSTTTDGRRLIQSLQDARANLVTRLGEVDGGQPKEFRTMQLADGRTYYVDPTGRTEPRLVSPDLQLPDKASAVEDRIQRVSEAYNVPRETAVGLVDGVLELSSTGEVINKLTGERVGKAPPTGAESIVARRTEPTAEGNFNRAVGGAGVLANIVNTGFDMVGLSPAAPEVMRAQTAMTNLALQTVTTMQEAFPGRASVQLMQQLEQLAARPAMLFRGEARTKDTMSQTASMIEQFIVSEHNKVTAPSGYTQAQRGEARARIDQLLPLLQSYEQILAKMGARGAPADSEVDPADLELMQELLRGGD